MSKLQSGADLKLIDAGLGLAREKGLTGFTVRQLCSKAGVNPGLFHYYFTSRDNFNRAVLKKLYNSEILEQFTVKIPQNLKSKEKLAVIIDLLGSFTRKNSSLLASLAVDVISGDRQILKFIIENFTVHVKTVYSIIEECKKDGILEDCDTVTLMLSLIVPIIAPNLVAGILKKTLDKKDFHKIEHFAENVLSGKYINERSRLALKAVLK